MPLMVSMSLAGVSPLCLRSLSEVGVTVLAGVAG
jgi:hypothetical protein